MVKKLFEISNFALTHAYLQYPDTTENSRVFISIGVHKLFITVPLWKTKTITDWSEVSIAYGFSVLNGHIWLHRGKKSTRHKLPW